MQKTFFASDFSVRRRFAASQKATATARLSWKHQSYFSFYRGDPAKRRGKPKLQNRLLQRGFGGTKGFFYSQRCQSGGRLLRPAFSMALHSLGVIPSHIRNARRKELGSSYPSREAVLLSPNDGCWRERRANSL